MPVFKMLDIDLTTGRHQVTDVSAQFDRDLGGTAVATSLLLDTPADLDPYAPEAPIIFATGPFSAVYPVATKTVALFRSPLTGNLGESHAGGRLAMAMYGAGFHVIRVRGASPFPCYVTIDEDQVHLHRAHSLWGSSALAAERILRDHVPSSYKRSIVRIGPAGERRSPLAAATVDSSRHFGRLGLGGVMGSKNLKALVVSGGRYWPIVEKGKYNAFYKKLYDAVVKSPAMKKYHDLGTAMNVVPLSRINSLPTRNFAQGFFEGADEISGETFATRHLTQHLACGHCQTGCIHMATLRERFHPEHHQFKTFKISYDHELIYALGSNLSISSPEEILRLLLLIEKQGWDAMSIGVTLAWAIDAFQAGHLTPAHTDGLVLNFGDAATGEKVLHRIARGHNEFYRDLERGAAFCARKYGGQDSAIAFGGNEAPGYMTGLYAYLGYATGVRHSHLDSAGYAIDQKALNEPKPDDVLTAELYKEALWRMTLNSLVICLFARNIYTKEAILEGLDALGLTGWTETRLHEAARRAHARKLQYKERCGFRFDDLVLPGKLARVVSGAGQVDPARFARQVAAYRDLARADLAAAADVADAPPSAIPNPR
ncbi:MAG: Tungsten-containing aldehyde:ferredoxin oxidoreductase [Candidatus Ozemobacter sibiricus]|uniref:Tungsten-containing aldehyde:ferredoxin oxidoreductase n=1 Tax=Candidatus Ozemobacter sibiricus TaxID=2268124 RepID=A0A367ZL73_9BACT|nr:MAG: Tungsten-containing aldehyde:ferredoxin oxidoreductase [Candidatus Ozemobacter sibiricus]